MLEKDLKDAAASTPDPERALKNLRSFYEENPEYREHLDSNIRPVSLLFSVSQFLANFSFSHPEALFDALGKIKASPDENTFRASVRSDIEELSSKETLMNIMRVVKKKMLLWITLRDVLGESDIIESMHELSFLADVIVEESLTLVRSQLRELYGEPENDAFSVIAVGKLGSSELNFSSDVDLLYVYGKEEGETSGIMTAKGIIKNRITSREYYSKVGETLNRFLSAGTENGFVYRVDLRLRPEGQRGSIALSLPAYEIYYESWGRVWERAVLLRARPVAGDAALGKDFLEMIEPFVYRKYLDFNAIDEIRRMKTKIDEVFKKDDIKRGYGGIREIEFFVHVLQLIYGGKEPLLRERSTLKGLHLLLQKNLIGSRDYSALDNNYRFLRKLEHRLQQLNDLQTHSLPSAEDELTALSRKTGFPGKKSFMADLENRRGMVRKIYDSLFMEKKGKPLRRDEKMSPFFSDELSDGELGELLRRYPVEDMGKVIRNIQHIREGALSFQTLRGQRLLDEILPVFLREALESRDPDAAVNNLSSFSTVLSSEESYLDLLAGNERLIPTLVHVFAQSDYLAKNIIKRKEYLDLLGREMFSKKTLSSLKKELRETIASGMSVADSIRTLKQREGIRLGILFLDKKIDTVRLVKGLSRTAEAVVSVCTDEFGEKGFLVIGMGKIGGREITFDSDLDLIFACEKDVREGHVKAAERLIRLLTSYTKDGAAYRVDARLRPDGTKGPLVSTLETLNNYYAGAAHFWEFQALLKARPIAGDRTAGRYFIEARKEILRREGKKVSASDIRGMRERILKELSREGEGYDIKLGPGGIEELEFTVQYLQLLNCDKSEGILAQGTLDAIKRLGAAGVIDGKEAELMKGSYLFYRTLESFLRLRGESLLKKEEKAVRRTSEFMGFRASREFLEHIENKREKVRKLFEKFLY